MRESNRAPRPFNRPMQVAFYLLCGAIACTSNPSGEGLAPYGVLPGYPGKDPSATKDYLKNHATFDKNHPRDSIYDGLVVCDEASKCLTTMGLSVNLRITPEKHAHTRRIDSNFFTNTDGGYFMARIINNDLDRRTYEAFDLAYGDSVFIWAGPLPDGTKKIGFFHVTPDGNATVVAISAAARWCPPATTVRRTISAVHVHGAASCQANPIYGALPAETHLAQSPEDKSFAKLANFPFRQSASVAAAVTVHNNGVWFSCQMGCCEAQKTM